MEHTIHIKDVGMRIMKLRKEKGYSRELLAELANISPSFLYEIEKSKKGFSANTLLGLLEALEVSPDYLIYGKSRMQCEEKIAEILGKFSQSDLRRIKVLLEIAYELASEFSC